MAVQPGEGSLGEAAQDQSAGRCPQFVFDVRKGGLKHGKNFVFTDQAAQGLSVKLPKDEAAAVIATDGRAEPTGYGLGRHGWVSIEVGKGAGAPRWQQIEEWVRTSYTLVAPKSLAKIVLAEDERR